MEYLANIFKIISSFYLTEGQSYTTLLVSDKCKLENKKMKM